MKKVLSEFLQKSAALRSGAGGEAPFGSPEARKRLFKRICIVLFGCIIVCCAFSCLLLILAF